MTGWASGWQEATLRASGIPVSQFALDVLSAWRKSTPVIPPTNNPLGMPARGNNAAPYLNTLYAAFPSITAFATAFKRFTASSKGAELLHVLVMGESLTDAYRAIHALGWPANRTETDYPSALLDMVEAKYRSKLQTRDVKSRKTTGIVQAPADVHAAVKQQAAMMHHAASTINDTSKAIGYIMRGLR